MYRCFSFHASRSVRATFSWLDARSLALLSPLSRLCAATVRSINHVRALHEYEPNESSSKTPAITGTLENRLSGFAIHALIGVMVLCFRPLLAQVPMPVLTGLFLYLGQSALKGNQMYERTVELVSDPALTANTPWKKAGIPRRTVALFTAVQFAALAGMIAVKNIKGFGVLFPILVAGLAPLRFALKPIFGFTSEQIEALDCEED